MDWESIARNDLDRLCDGHLYRRRRVVRPLDATHVQVDGRRLVNFSSNDYLGLTHHAEVIAAVRAAVERDGAGSGAAPLITGYTPAHASAERAIATWKGTAAAVLLPSGYQANLAAVQTLAVLGEKVREAGGEAPARGIGWARFLLDKLCHASLIDAVRGEAGRGGAGRGTGRRPVHPFRVFPHNDLSKLRRLLRDGAAAGGPPAGLPVVVTESIFSMDGDAADLAGLAELKREHEFLLLLDDAHGSGVYGPGGSGLAAERGLGGVADVTIVTLSKALGCSGAAVCGSETFCQLLVNYARPFIYSTAPPSGVAAAAEAAIGVLRREPQRQRRVRDVARQVREEWSDAGLRLAGGPTSAGADSPIIPVLLASEPAAVSAAEGLFGEGLLVLPIRPPTVPRGTSRLRVTLSCEHTDAEVRKLIGAVTAAVRAG